VEKGLITSEIVLQVLPDLLQRSFDEAHWAAEYMLFDGMNSESFAVEVTYVIHILDYPYIPLIQHETFIIAIDYIYMKAERNFVR
jgi:hypothetical protein